MGWLQQKLGTFIGFVVYGVLKRIWDAVVAFAKDKWNKWVRGRRQEKATEKQKENIQQGKPSDEQTDKDELDWLNS